MFGLSLEGDREQVVVPPTDLALRPGQVVFVTGVSGGGKSTLLRLIAQAIEAAQRRDAASSPGLVHLDRLPALPDTALVDALAQPEADQAHDQRDATLEEVCGWLSRAGLNDAAVMLRRPGELSEGQRYRLRLAQAVAAAERDASAWSVLLADEFGSMLDRTTATMLARSVRRWVAASSTCLVAATAHDDLLEALRPDTLVEVAPAGRCAVHTRPS
jgi:hypothetical protein